MVVVSSIFLWTLLTSWPSWNRYRLQRTLGAQGEAAYAQQQAAEGLVRNGPVAVQGLIDCLKHGDRTGRWWAAWALGEIGADAKQALPELIAATQSSDQRLRSRVIESLITIAPEDSAIIAILESDLTEDDASKRQDAIIWLGRIGLPASQAIARALHNPDPNVRRGATEALRLWRGDAIALAPDLIHAYLQDENENVRSGAFLTLHAMGPALGPTLLDAFEQADSTETASWLANLLTQVDPESSQVLIPRLATMIQSPDLGTRYRVILSLIRIGQPALPALSDALSSSDSETRSWAVEVLKHIDPTASLEADPQ